VDRAIIIHISSYINSENAVNRDAPLEVFAAELTVAAYRVALRTSKQAAWLDPQLGPWRALAEKVKTWGPAAERAGATMPAVPR